MRQDVPLHYARPATFARLTDQSKRTVHRLISEGVIPSVKVGGVRLIPVHDALAALANSGPRVGAGAAA